MQVLLGQTSIQNLILRGRGEIEFCTGQRITWFDLGTVSNLTTLHIKTDRLAYICIPAPMHLRSLEMYAPIVWLYVEEPYGWARDIAHLRLVYLEFLWKPSDGRAIAGSPGWRWLPLLNDDSERALHTTFCQEGGGHCIKSHCEEDGSRHALCCRVLEGCRFDTGMPAAISVYNGGAVACSCGICWMCLQPERKD